MKDNQTWNAGGVSETTTAQQGNDIGAAAVFAPPEQSLRVDVKVGFSHISAEQARRNIQREAPGWYLTASATRRKRRGRANWARSKSRAAAEEQRTIFYSALYRVMGRPSNLVEGVEYFSGADHKVHPAEGHGFYVGGNLWGSYRSLHPMQLLLDPQRQVDFVRSYMRLYEQWGWMLGYGRMSMIGHHMTALAADTWFKGYRDFDLAKAYEGLRKNRMEATMVPWRRGPRTALDRHYQEKGYFPALAPGEKESRTASRRV